MDATQTRIGNSAELQNQFTAPAAYDPYSDPECLLTTNECAALRGCSASTIRRERNERRGVPFIAVNYNVVRYRRGDILDFIAGLKRVETSNPGSDQAGGD
jgi:hypothetical protein